MKTERMGWLGWLRKMAMSGDGRARMLVRYVLTRHEVPSDTAERVKEWRRSGRMDGVTAEHVVNRIHELGVEWKSQATVSGAHDEKDWQSLGNGGWMRKNHLQSNAA